MLAFFFIEAVSQSCCRRLVDDPLYVKTRDLSCVLCCLLLAVCKVSRYCDYRFSYRAAELALSIRLQLGQDHCADVLRSVSLVIDHYIISFAHVSLD